MSYNALHEKKSLSVRFMAIEKSCTAIPVHTSKVIHCQPQPQENSNIERNPFQLHLTQLGNSMGKGNPQGLWVGVLEGKGKGSRSMTPDPSLYP